MARSINNIKLTKNNILERVSQISIFSAYLNIPDYVIINCIDSGQLICSPLRIDKHPTCGFKYDNKGKLKFKDFSGYFWGDCFDLVAFIMSNMYNKEINISNKEDFISVLRHISFTFKDIFYGTEKDSNLINNIHNTINKIQNTKTIIELVVRESWNTDDTKYWGQFGITLKWLNINFIYPVEQYYINRKTNPYPKYFYDKKDPCYAYMLGKDKNGIDNIKLYFPFRKHNETRFITNCNHLEGIYNLERNDYDYIIITKSTKDRLSIGSILNTIQLPYKIGVINIPHETYILRDLEYEWLKSKIININHLVSLMDNDYTGLKEAIELRNYYGIMPIIINKNYNAKDFAELVKINPLENIIDYIEQTKEIIDDYECEDSQYIRNKKESESLPY